MVPGNLDWSLLLTQAAGGILLSAALPLLLGALLRDAEARTKEREATRVATEGRRGWRRVRAWAAHKWRVRGPQTVAFGLATLVCIAGLVALVKPELPTVTVEPTAVILHPARDDVVPSRFTVEGTAETDDAPLYVLVWNPQVERYVIAARTRADEGRWSADAYAGGAGDEGKPFAVVVGVADPDADKTLLMASDVAATRCDYRGEATYPLGFRKLAEVWVVRGEHVLEPAPYPCTLPKVTPPPVVRTLPWARIDTLPLPPEGDTRDNAATVDVSTLRLDGMGGDIPPGRALHVLLYSPTANQSAPVWAQGRGVPMQADGTWNATVIFGGPGLYRIVVGYADEEAHGAIARWSQRNDDRGDWSQGLPHYPPGFTPLTARWVVVIESSHR